MEIRRMQFRDIEQVALLCKQWGYSVRVEQVRKRFEQICTLSEHRLFVCICDSDVSGWLHAQGVHSLGTEPFAEIRGIVVDENQRRQGVGRQLILEAEKWAIENGYATIRLRSGIERPEAHYFYPKLGYDRTKSQHVYQKVLIEMPS